MLCFIEEAIFSSEWCDRVEQRLDATDKRLKEIAADLLPRVNGAHVTPLSDPVVEIELSCDSEISIDV